MTEFGATRVPHRDAQAVPNTGADSMGLAALMSQWQEAGILRGELSPSWLAASFTSLAIALHGDSGPLSVSVEFGCRAELLFESFASRFARTVCRPSWPLVRDKGQLISISC